MSANNIIQLITTVVYSILIIFALKNRINHGKGTYIVFLISSLSWSISSYFAYSGYGNGDPWIARFVVLSATWSIVSYTIFISDILSKSWKIPAISGYVLLVIVFLVIVSQNVPSRFDPVDIRLNLRNAGYWLYIWTSLLAGFIVYVFYLLYDRYHSNLDKTQRSMFFILLIGALSLLVVGVAFEVFPLHKFVFTHTGQLLNALCISLALFRGRHHDFKQVVYNVVVYAGLASLVTVIYLLVVGISRITSHSVSFYYGLIAPVLVIASLFLFYNFIRMKLENLAGLIIYGKTCNYRRLLLNFSEKLCNVPDLKEIVHVMQELIVQSLQCSRIGLLFYSSQEYTLRFSDSSQKYDRLTHISLPESSAIVGYLRRENKLLTFDQMHCGGDLELEYRQYLEFAGVNLLCPVKTKNRLIAIIVLGHKLYGGNYSQDDISLLSTIANNVAVAMENAEVCCKAVESINIDELTGLFNHRCFHQRISEEISRCSRFGQIFSLAFLDIDCFGHFNEVNGHLAGDEMLRQIALTILQNKREVDLGFRYGGDEFAIIFPQTGSEDASIAVDRIRRSIQNEMDLKGMPLTVSAGIASWPENGVLKEELIKTSLATLYYAKQQGKNCVCTASRTVLMEETLRKYINPKTESARALILDTIYALAATVDAKDHYTYGHSKKVSAYASEIAERLGYDEGGINRIRTAALLHDIGKIGVSDGVLNKKGSLTPLEYQSIQTHPELGAAIIKYIEQLSGCLSAILYHHEKYNGSGYPGGLKGTDIPLDARILAVADAFDAMTSARPYRKAKTIEEALNELQRCAGSQFDPVIVDIFVKMQIEKNGREVAAGA